MTTKEMTRYILFCAQEANFQTRSMLIPYDLIMQCPERVKDLEVLRQHAVKNVEFQHRDQKYLVDQLLVQNITWIGNLGKRDETPFSRIINEFRSYADGMDSDCYIQMYDKEWYKDAICHIASKGFNHVVNYCDFKKRMKAEKYSTEIVEGFLVLESNNGKLSMPPVDTVEEMFSKYYSD